MRLETETRTFRHSLRKYELQNHYLFTINLLCHLWLFLNTLSLSQASFITWHLLVYSTWPYCKGGRTRANKIGVGAGGDIGGTDISCIFMARQYKRPTRQSYRDDHRHVSVIPATLSINTRARCAEQVRTRLPCDVRCFDASLEKKGAWSFVRVCNRSL